MIEVKIEQYIPSDERSNQCSLCEKHPALILVQFIDRRRVILAQTPLGRLDSLSKPKTKDILFGYRACGKCLLTHGKKYQTILSTMVIPQDQ